MRLVFSRHHPPEKVMIKPHGSDQLRPLYVDDDRQRERLIKDAESLPSLLISSAAAANAVMLGAGYFTPLDGYMNMADALSVAETMHTTGGLFWPIPIMNLTQDPGAITGAKRIALRDPNVTGNPVIAVQTVNALETLSDEQLDRITDKVFGSLSPEHPGVATFKAHGKHVISGPIEVLNFSYFPTDFPDTFRTAPQIRENILKKGWKKVVAFQTRNPMHRAHEELCKMAMASVGANGVLIHMLLGKLKPGDIPAEGRDAAVRKMGAL